MGKNKLDFLKNRCLKIERNKKKRKNIKYNRYRICKGGKTRINLNRSQKTFDKYKFFSKPKTCSENETIINIPQSFNLIENPDESIKTLMEINYAFEKTDSKNIIFDYSNCNNLGLDASIICDLLVLNGKKYRNQANKNAKISGNMPNGYNAGEIFCNSGLLKHLNLFKKEDPLVERLEPFNQEKDVNKATNQTIIYYNNCLKRYGYTLNEKGVNYFNKLVDEIIGNANEHSGENGEWYVSGHFTQAGNCEYGRGNLVFVSIGNTIYENLKYNTKSKNTMNKLESHLKSHRSLFDFNWNEESSLTVLGLQYKISSATDDKHPDRGTGTIEFINSFTNLGRKVDGDVPKMAIISGNTHILFDGTYTLKERKVKNKIIKTIAFNKENNIKKKPDPNYVKILKNSFPGVIISVNFYVDKRYLNELKKEEV